MQTGRGGPTPFGGGRPPDPADLEYTHGGLPGPFTWKGLAAAIVAAVLVGGGILLGLNIAAGGVGEAPTLLVQPHRVVRGEEFVVVVRVREGWTWW